MIYQSDQGAAQIETALMWSQPAHPSETVSSIDVNPYNVMTWLR